MRAQVGLVLVLGSDTAFQMVDQMLNCACVGITNCAIGLLDVRWHSGPETSCL